MAVLYYHSRVGAEPAKLSRTTTKYLSDDYLEVSEPELATIQLLDRVAAELSPADYQEVLRFVEHLRSRKAYAQA